MESCPPTPCQLKAGSCPEMWMLPKTFYFWSIKVSSLTSETLDLFLVPLQPSSSHCLEELRSTGSLQIVFQKDLLFSPFILMPFSSPECPFFATARRGDQPQSSDLCSHYLSCFCHVSSFSSSLWTRELPNWLRPWGHPVFYLLLDASQRLILLWEAQALRAKQKWDNLPSLLDCPWIPSVKCQISCWKCWLSPTT